MQYRYRPLVHCFTASGAASLQRLTVQPGSRDSGDEELRALGVGASVRHGQISRRGVLNLEVLV
jgi:hypothetical protein